MNVREAGLPRLRWLPFTLSTLIALAASGCSGADEDGPRRAAVSGTVMLDGQPLAEGVIRFIPSGDTEGPQATATIENGAFALPAEFGPVVGSHRVEIESTDTGGLAMDDEQALERLQKQLPKKPLEVVRVPAIYNERSRLSEDISDAKPNELHYELFSNELLSNRK